MTVWCEVKGEPTQGLQVLYNLASHGAPSSWSTCESPLWVETNAQVCLIFTQFHESSDIPCYWLSSGRSRWMKKTACLPAFSIARCSSCNFLIHQRVIVLQKSGYIHTCMVTTTDFCNSDLLDFKREVPPIYSTALKEKLYWNVYQPRIGHGNKFLSTRSVATCRPS